MNNHIYSYLSFRYRTGRCPTLISVPGCIFAFIEVPRKKTNLAPKFFSVCEEDKDIQLLNIAFVANILSGVSFL